MAELTIRERFAKYTLAELAEALENLDAKIKDDETAMKEYQERGNVEFYRMAKSNYDEHTNLWLDINCAYTARIERGETV